MIPKQENRRSLLLIALAAAPLSYGFAQLEVLPRVQADVCCWYDDTCRAGGNPYAYCDYLWGCYQTGEAYQCKF
jgi:hypothetical protein